jgi:hypothetical protein
LFHLRSIFVDLDNSTKTSAKQLKFLGEQERLITADIINAFKRIEIKTLFNVIEQLSETSFEEFYLDFGAPESEQLPNLFSMDFTAEEFKEFEASVKEKFVFNIVISGGPAYRSCM